MSWIEFQNWEHNNQGPSDLAANKKKKFTSQQEELHQKKPAIISQPNIKQGKQPFRSHNPTTNISLDYIFIKYGWFQNCIIAKLATM